MINCKYFYEKLREKGVGFFAGVPDSLLKDICAYITDHSPPNSHIIAANEGNAVALACGHFLATHKPALVYMQNSGQGNAVNPLVSLADPDVYQIPCLLLIGWRGEPGVKDEPQHVKQGKITLTLMETLGIPFHILPQTEKGADLCIEQALTQLKQTNAPVALIVRKNTFEPYSLQNKQPDQFQLQREEAIKLIVDQLSNDDIIVSTTGKTSRELYEYRDALDKNHSRDFLTVGSMGHASQIALAIALAKPSQQVFCLDGDGATLMHMGGLAIIGSKDAPNFKHVVINNGAHDSVGGQPTVGFDISIAAIASECGYKKVMEAHTSEQISNSTTQLIATKGPAMLEIKTRRGARADLGRPKTSPVENKNMFMDFVNQ